MKKSFEYLVMFSLVMVLWGEWIIMSKLGPPEPTPTTQPFQLDLHNAQGEINQASLHIDKAWKLVQDAKVKLEEKK